jgi:hypothetical protein
MGKALFFNGFLMVVSLVCFVLMYSEVYGAPKTYRGRHVRK